MFTHSPHLARGLAFVFEVFSVRVFVLLLEIIYIVFCVEYFLTEIKNDLNCTPHLVY